ncbi:MAG: patatin-like phospholipase family protein [Desulfotalea sp.]
MDENKTVSLVLGSGGARGLAHIGVIRWLESNNFTIKSIAGCSAGALVGGIYASGKLDIFEKWVRGIDTLDIVTLLDLSWSSGGFLKGEKFINEMIKLVGEVEINKLPINFTAVATDIHAGKEVWLQDGNLFDAIRASISIPVLFQPFPYHGKTLIDGGVLNPVPIAPTFGDKTDLTIAVNLNSSRGISKEIVNEGKNSKRQDTSMKNKLNNIIEDLQNSFSSKDVYMAKKLGIDNIALQAFDAMQASITRSKLAAYPPDRTININQNACKMLDFNKAEEMIELGFQSCKHYMTIRLETEQPTD